DEASWVGINGGMFTNAFTETMTDRNWLPKIKRDTSGHVGWPDYFPVLREKTESNFIDFKAQRTRAQQAQTSGVHAELTAQRVQRPRMFLPASDDAAALSTTTPALDGAKDCEVPERFRKKTPGFLDARSGDKRIQLKRFHAILLF